MTLVAITRDMSHADHEPFVGEDVVDEIVKIEVDIDGIHVDFH